MDEHQERGATTTRPASGWWQVVAGPFTRADRLRAFLTTVGGIEGVTGLVAERFQQGEIALRLRYAGTQPLVDSLAAMAEFAPWVEAVGNGTVRLRLSDMPPGS